MGLYKRGKGKIWWMDYMVDGRQKCESTGTSNKRLAKKIHDLRRTEIVEGRFTSLLKSHTPKQEDYSRQYIDSRTDLHPNTVRRYECSKRSLDVFFSEARLPEISEARIEEYKKARLREGAHAAGVNRDLAFLRLVLRQARRERYIALNPLDSPDLFMNERRERLQAKPFTLEEEQRLLAVAKGYLRPLVLLLVDGGLRVGKEALPLRWSALDLESENAVVYVRASKTAAGIRTIPLTGRLKAELLRWRQLTGPSVSPFVFFYPINPSKHLQSVPKTWARVLRDAGVEPRRIYDLRSTFATRLNAAGVPQVFIDQLMGHSGGLAQAYAKASDEYRRAAIDKLEAFILSKNLDAGTPTISHTWVN
jgi:integrase